MMTVILMRIGRRLDRTLSARSGGMNVGLELQLILGSVAFFVVVWLVEPLRFATYGFLLLAGAAKLIEVEM
jgi:hypothetical protein